MLICVVDGNSVQTYDVCFHPETLQYAAHQLKFHDMVVRSAMEGVEKAMGAKKLEAGMLFDCQTQRDVQVDDRLSCSSRCNV